MGIFDVLVFFLFVGLFIAGIGVVPFFILRELSREWKQRNLNIAPMKWREAVSILLAVASFEFLLHPQTMLSCFPTAGLACFLFFWPMLIFAVGESWKRWRLSLVLMLMLWAVGARCLYTVPSGFLVLFIPGLFLLLAASVNGQRVPLERGGCAVFLFASIVGAFFNVFRIAAWPFRGFFFRKGNLVNLAVFTVPAVLLLVFGAIFFFANWDLKNLGWMVKKLENVLEGIFLSSSGSAEFVESCAVWLAVGLGFAGLIAGKTWKNVGGDTENAASGEREVSGVFYQAARNSLWALCVLFALDLVWEVRVLALWAPPADFCLGTFCHEGAAWLTAALVLTVGVLWGIFARKMERNAQSAFLEKLAFFWIFENFLLVGAIFVRLGIYVDHSGLTCLRMVGFFGTAAVGVWLVLAFLLLVQREGMAPIWNRCAWSSLAIVWLYLVLPVDAFVWRVNTSRILAGDRAPFLHISEQKISDEGLVQMMPLLCLEDKTVHEGIASEICRRIPGVFFDADSSLRWPENWRQYNYVERSLREQVIFYAPWLEAVWGVQYEIHTRFREKAKASYPPADGNTAASSPKCETRSVEVQAEADPEVDPETDSEAESKTEPDRQNT